MMPTFLYHTKGHSSHFSDKEMVGGGDPFYLKFWATLTLLERNADFQPIFARSASAVTCSDKIQ